ELDKSRHVVEGAVSRRADARDPRLDAPDLRDLRGDLRSGQHSAESRLGALAQLDLDRANGRAAGGLDQLLQVEGPVAVAASEVAGADLPDELAAAPVVVGQTSLAGVLQ